MHELVPGPQLALCPFPGVRSPAPPFSLSAPSLGRGSLVFPALWSSAGPALLAFPLVCAHGGPSVMRVWCCIRIETPLRRRPQVVRARVASSSNEGAKASSEQEGPLLFFEPLRHPPGGRGVSGGSAGAGTRAAFRRGAPRPLRHLPTAAGEARGPRSFLPGGGLPSWRHRNPRPGRVECSFFIV